jgi:hypothetical protein
MTLELFGNASLPPCISSSINFTANPLKTEYKWSIYQNTSYLPDLESYSRDPRYFKLYPYKLNPATIYTVKLTVSLNSLTNVNLIQGVAVYTLNVGKSSVKALIKGGNVLVVNSLQAVTLDASSSYDLDYPNDLSKVSFSWSCFQYFPNYGEPCSGFDQISSVHSPILEIPSSTFSSNAMYNNLLQTYIPSEENKMNQFTAFNQFPYTLEQEVVKKMAPIVQSGSVLNSASYKPLLDNLHDASPVNASD